MEGSVGSFGMEGSVGSLGAAGNLSVRSFNDVASYDFFKLSNHFPPHWHNDGYTQHRLETRYSGNTHAQHSQRDGRSQRTIGSGAFSKLKWLDFPSAACCYTASAHLRFRR